MKVFISWSGEKSKKTAEVISKWLQKNIQAVEPWMSTDIEKGQRWQPALYKKLEESRIGIICLNRDNLESKWIMFEAGAIAKMVSSYTCTFLLDLAPKDVEPPLADFQHTIFNRDDLLKLLYTVNRLVEQEKEKFLEKDNLNEMFELLWPNLSKELSEISKSSQKEKKPIRTSESILEEILNLNRNIDSKIDDRTLLIARLIEKSNRFSKYSILASDVANPSGSVTELLDGTVNASLLAELLSTGGTAGTANINVSSAPGPTTMGLREAKRKILDGKEIKDGSEKE